MNLSVNGGMCVDGVCMVLIVDKMFNTAGSGMQFVGDVFCGQDGCESDGWYVVCGWCLLVMVVNEMQNTVEGGMQFVDNVLCGSILCVDRMNVSVNGGMCGDGVRMVLVVDKMWNVQFVDDIRFV